MISASSKSSSHGSFNDSELDKIHSEILTNSIMAATEGSENVSTTHGLPNTIASDNGSAFTSDKASKFTKQNGIEHIKMSPYYPAKNGLAKRSVQTYFCLKRITEDPLQAKSNKFLFQYQ